ncbi:hypothetical protein CDO87_07385 [Sagittula sp. P11]|uniref:hypothetical protein n=1 Tax=Sagittula sp. P11 TaxID=2009329 RepID=UPI000C2D151F|nr:hypothetical protein [Sagittula sp. P11]AUC53029.1 hypothetical protein CDO87_07385 [Sagittula sp. P11]
MGFTWSAPRPHTFRDAYLDWSRLLGKRLDALPPERPDSGAEYEPIFVALKTGTDALAVRQALVDALAASTVLLMDPHETQALQTRIDDPATHAALPDEYALYRKVGTPDSEHASLFDVLDTGVPVRLEEAPAAVASAPGPAPAAEAIPPGTPIVAIIDDGVGFLNARFRKFVPDGTARTRFHAVWLQALESRSTEGGVLSGQVLNAADIDALLPLPEDATYARLNRALGGVRTRPALGAQTSHGTHVLDLAAGADPLDEHDPVRDWPLIAVQLPSETIDDTSGMWFESYMVQGLRWILRRAAEIDAAAPVIVNLSLGITAGPKNGTRFVERQLAREARVWEEVTGQPVRIVWSFGNSYRDGLLCAFDLQQGAEAQAVVRVQPDDMTASFVEFHPRGGVTGDLALSVTAPDGTTTGYLKLQPGEIVSLEDKGTSVARLYHVPERPAGADGVEAAHYTLALAPTKRRKPREEVAQPGAWTIDVRQDGDAEVCVLCQIQRDDALGGSLMRGRQAYFDHTGAYGWSKTAASYTQPQDDCPVTPSGCHNALVTTAARQVFSCGAAVWTPRHPVPTHANFAPAFYSAQGSEWTVATPTVSTLVDHGAFSGGTRGCGTLSGSARRLGGTSAAAGRLTRALGLSAGLIAANAQNPATTQTDDLDPAALDLFEVDEGRRSRLGAYIVVAQGSGPGADLPV